MFQLVNMAPKMLKFALMRHTVLGLLCKVQVQVQVRGIWLFWCIMFFFVPLIVRLGMNLHFIFGVV